MRKKVKKRQRTLRSEGRSFACVFEQNEKGGYTVTCPSLPGLVTEGKNLEDAKRMAREALALHCECLLEEEHSLPPEQDLIVGMIHVPASKRA